MSFFIFSLFFVSFYHVLCSDLKVLKSGYEASPSSVGLQLYVDVTNGADDDFQVELTPQQCCLESGDEVDCEVIEILGNCFEDLPKGTTKRLNLVAPLPDLFNRKGFCKLYLDSKANENLDEKREIIKIGFDTADTENQNDGSKNCKTVDENPNDNCKPVDCETYYNGRKSYFSKNLNRCVEVPPCVADDDVDVSIYDSKTNTCVDGDSVRSQDIEFIKTMEKNKRQVFDFKKKEKVKAADNKTSDNKTLVDKTLDNNATLLDSKPHKCYLHKHFPNNNLTLIILSSVVMGQCLIICLVFYFFAHCINCCKQNKNNESSFKPNPVASDTTPLIQGNTDTDSTNYQVLNESIDFDKKIKCYKACQKDGKDMKSMSDDILSKCINRRTWERKYHSNHKPEYFDALNSKDVRDVSDKDDLNSANSIKLNNTGTYLKINVEHEINHKIHSTDKVDFINEIHSNNQKNPKGVTSTQYFRKFNDVKLELDDNDSLDEECTLLETEVRSFNYNSLDSNEKLSKDSDNYLDSNYKLSKHSSKRSLKISKSKPSIVLSQKSALANFSNDSMDDFLSETGHYAPCENISKYSLATSSSSRKSLSSNVSEKSSKHVFRKVMSLFLHRRRKQGPVSDPGPMGSNARLELLRMRDMVNNKKSSLSSSFNDLKINMLSEDLSN